MAKEKLMTEDQLAKQAADYFNRYKKEDEFHACQDGHFYFGKDKHLAEEHNNQVIKGEVFTFKRSEIKESKAPASKKDNKPAADQPTEKWTNDQLKAYMQEKEIAFESADNKKDLLKKIADAASGDDPEGDDPKE